MKNFIKKRIFNSIAFNFVPDFFKIVYLKHLIDESNSGINISELLLVSIAREKEINKGLIISLATSNDDQLLAMSSLIDAVISHAHDDTTDLHTRAMRGFLALSLYY